MREMSVALAKKLAGLRGRQHPADRLVGLGQDDADARGRGAAGGEPGALARARPSCASTPTCSARRPSRATPARSCCAGCWSGRASSSAPRRPSSACWSRRRTGLVFVDEVDKIRSHVGGQPNVSGIRAQEALLTLIENEAVPFTLPRLGRRRHGERRLERPALRLRRRLRGPLRRRLPPRHGRAGTRARCKPVTVVDETARVREELPFALRDWLKHRGPLRVRDEPAVPLALRRGRAARRRSPRRRSRRSSPRAASRACASRRPTSRASASSSR